MMMMMMMHWWWCTDDECENLTVCSNSNVFVCF